jgi:hypothetical protein
MTTNPTQPPARPDDFAARVEAATQSVRDCTAILVARAQDGYLSVSEVFQDATKAFQRAIDALRSLALSGPTPPAADDRHAARVEAWRKGAVSEPCKPPNADPNGPYPIGYWLSAGEVDEAIEMMHRPAAEPAGETNKKDVALARLRVLLACAPDGHDFYLIQRDLKVEALRLLDAAGITAEFAGNIADRRKPPTTCPTCGGAGQIEGTAGVLVGGECQPAMMVCPECKGSPAAEPAGEGAASDGPFRAALLQCWAEAIAAVADAAVVIDKPYSVEFVRDWIIRALRDLAKHRRPSGEASGLAELRDLIERLEHARNEHWCHTRAAVTEEERWRLAIATGINDAIRELRKLLAAREAPRGAEETT